MQKIMKKLGLLMKINLANKIKSFIKQLHCDHKDVDLIRWHWTHGTNGNDLAFVEIEYCCKECEKTIYLYQHGKEAHDWAKVMGSYKYGR